MKAASKVLDEALGHWLAGLVDGEGCFYFATRRRRLDRYPGKLFRSIVFHFQISLRADDRAVLELARTVLFGLGRIKSYETKRYSLRGEPRQGSPQFCWSIENREDIPALIAFFRKFPLRSKKAKDFQIWAAAFELFQSCVQNTELSWCRKDQIARASRVGRRPLKGTQRQRFRTIPDDIFDKMVKLETDLKEGRRFVQ